MPLQDDVSVLTCCAMDASTGAAYDVPVSCGAFIDHRELIEVFFHTLRDGALNPVSASWASSHSKSFVETKWPFPGFEEWPL